MDQGLRWVVSARHVACFDSAQVREADADLRGETPQSQPLRLAELPYSFSERHLDRIPKLVLIAGPPQLLYDFCTQETTFGHGMSTNHEFGHPHAFNVTARTRAACAGAFTPLGGE